jgi:hypothetical protein
MMLPIENCDYFVQVMPFGVPIPAFIRLNPDGYTYTLYLNSDWNSQTKRRNQRYSG